MLDPPQQPCCDRGAEEQARTDLLRIPSFALAIRMESYFPSRIEYGEVLMTEMNLSALAVAGLAGLAALTNVLRPASGAGVSFFAKASSRYWTTSFGDLFARTAACARAATGIAIKGASTDATAERRAKRLPAVDDHTRHGISALSHTHPAHSTITGDGTKLYEVGTPDASSSRVGCFAHM